jgi:hypothetical protein
MVEISHWRHAIINFPHPLLKQGLVILDTPGLNAIGTEPELTLNLIPNAHAVLFILAADTGVTSDIEVWRNHIGAGAGRLVVLNKIDSMWDELRSEEDINAEIERQQASRAHAVAGAGQVFPVSAQKALVGKINHDVLLARSRLHALEGALFNELIPAKKEIVRKQLSEELQALNTAQHGHAERAHPRHRRAAARAEEPARQEPERGGAHDAPHRCGEEGVRRQPVQAAGDARGVHAPVDRAVHLHGHGHRARRYRAGARGDAAQPLLHRRARGGARLLRRTRANLDAAEHKTVEITEMMGVMYRRFASEHG